MVLVAAEPPSNTLKTTERMVDDVADADQQIPRKGESSIVRHDDLGKFAEKMAVRILGDMITNLRLLPSFRAVFNELIKYLKDAKYVDIRVSNLCLFHPSLSVVTAFINVILIICVCNIHL